MSAVKRNALVALGILAALLITSQFVMGMLIIQGASNSVRKAHQHSGYLTAVVVFLYAVWSTMTLASLPKPIK